MARKPKILAVTIERKIDQDPDTSWMGEYANEPSSDYSIDRKERGDQRRNEFRYFNPSFNYVDDRGNLVDGNTPEEVRKYVEQDYARMERLNQGDWSFIGIIAKAEVKLSDSDLVQRIHSGGLWGIESDSDAAYTRQVEDEQLSELTAELESIGCTRKQILAAYENIERD